MISSSRTRGKLIVIEGLDGSGKETQCNLLVQNLKNTLSRPVSKLSFPDYDCKSSELVKLYLNGQFGLNARDVNTYASSSFYAIDRFVSYETKWKSLINSNYVLVSDRYTTSNLLYQTVKLPTAERDKYIDWLLDYEYRLLQIPQPDIVIFLEVPVDFSQDLIKNRNNKINNSINKDIHESDRNFLSDVYENSIKISEKFGWNVIKCVKNQKLLSVEEISNTIMNIIRTYFGRYLNS